MQEGVQVGLVVVALVSGGLTVVYIVSGLRRALVRHRTLGVRALLVTTACSLLTAVFTIWQLVLVAQQLGLAR